jgi:hypothetical protein
MKLLTKKRKVLVEVEIPQVGFFFDEVNHIYYLDGKKMHGVTSILKVIAKPALIQWAANCACDYILDDITKSAYLPDKKAQKEHGKVALVKVDHLMYLIQEARTAHTKKKEAAGEAGSDVHSQIENYVKKCLAENEGFPLRHFNWENPNAQLKLFHDWACENKVKFLESEKRVYSRESWYAGTLDLVLEMDGRKYIADVKTSSGIYPEFYLQMAAYQGALEEMGEHTDISGAMVINLPKKGGFEIGMNYDYAGNRLAFLGFLVGYKQLNAIS